MIDGLFKRHIDPLWESLSTPLVRIGMTPNQVTATGLLLVAATSLAYAIHGNALIFGVTLAFSFAFDALDGAVARRRDMCSRSGGYFDAMVDRYQELAVLAAIAYVNDAWALALLALSGGVFTSYAKARTAIEMPISNEAWPDLFERLERTIFLCVMLIIAGAVPASLVASSDVVIVGLALYSALAHITALQRTRRAVGMLRAAERDDA
ncbi:CDP-alcohol phosphatidyltransferase family protein [Stappia taiwanensis]|uniref:CDP-alcohol phosphatidyltransferase family protein n=1 Tax=Stappia taiwanensis TaxID=992267 RepID=A0A838XMI1_9HYPH|nr:CDP-alcohol phosphatidyltransferase family protein [Stappia taiwanensis]MBA4612489.1 CDP-alcohol phosphatidyltransferase family protein [Stappia taiwanensis]GGF05751.1 hypothetical protein GCM10007285_37040 [Stappia taiwanensis]